MFIYSESFTDHIESDSLRQAIADVNSVILVESLVSFGAYASLTQRIEIVLHEA